MKHIFLKAKKTTEPFQFRPRGNSMVPLIKSGELVTVLPLSKDDYENLKKDDVVLCKVEGRIYLHKITAIKGTHPNRSFQISNNKGRVNGWTRNIVGLVTDVNP